jgi:hypothetical protein
VVTEAILLASGRLKRSGVGEIPSRVLNSEDMLIFWPLVAFVWSMSLVSELLPFSEVSENYFETF